MKAFMAPVKLPLAQPIAFERSAIVVSCAIILLRLNNQPRSKNRPDIGAW